MANETIGIIKHHCKNIADVRKNKNGKLYLSCPFCGLLAYALPGGQDYILANAEMYGAPGFQSVKMKAKITDVSVDRSLRYEKEVLKKTVKQDSSLRNEKEEKYGLEMMNL